MKKIILTGGGSAGHVMPHLAIILHLKQSGYEIHYIGTADGIERGLIEPIEGITYYPISAGKLRRYKDLRNLTDPFRVIKGTAQAFNIIRKVRPSIIFSKGGFVAVPVTVAASLCRVPTVLHECDLTPGLANKIAIPFCKKICTTFPETAEQIGGKAVCTGLPMREQLFMGDKKKAAALFNLGQSDKPVLMIVGGSLGAKKVNDTVRESLDKLLPVFDILHLTGRGHIDADKQNVKGYHQVEFLNEEMPDAFALADIVLSRSGSNTIHEILALGKPNVLVPWPREFNRGDQEENAESFSGRGYSKILPQAEMTGETLLATLLEVYNNRDRYVGIMNSSGIKNGVSGVLEQIYANEK